MSLRNTVCLLMAVFIVIATLALVPSGHGPFSAVNGPGTTFGEHRTALALKHAMGVSVIISTTNLLDLSRQAPSNLEVDFHLASATPLPIPLTLRC